MSNYCLECGADVTREPIPSVYDADGVPLAFYPMHIHQQQNTGVSDGR